MIIDIFPFKDNDFTSIYEQAKKLKEMVDEIHRHSSEIQTKFMIIYEEKHDYSFNKKRGLVYAEYDICRDKMFFEDDFDDRHRFKFLYLWALPESVPPLAQDDEFHTVQVLEWR